MPLSLLSGSPGHRNSVRAIHSQPAKSRQPSESCRRHVQGHWKRQWPRQKALKRGAFTCEAPSLTGESTPIHPNCSSSLLWQVQTLVFSEIQRKPTPRHSAYERFFRIVSLILAHTGSHSTVREGLYFRAESGPAPFKLLTLKKTIQALQWSF